MGDTVSKATQTEEFDADGVRTEDVSTQTAPCLTSSLPVEPDTSIESVVVDDGGTGIEDVLHAPPPDYDTAQLDVPTMEFESNLEPLVADDDVVETEGDHHILPAAEVTAPLDVLDVPIRRAPRLRFKPNPWSVAYGDDGEEADRMQPMDFGYLIDYEPRLDEYHIMIVGRPKKDKKKKKQYWQRKEPASTASAQSAAYDPANDPLFEGVPWPVEDKPAYDPPNDPFFEGVPWPVEDKPSNNTASFNGTSAPMAQNTPKLDPFDVPTLELAPRTREIDPWSVEAEGIQYAQKVAAANNVWPDDQPKDESEDYWPEEDESDRENFRPGPLDMEIPMCQLHAGKEYSVVVGGMFEPPNDYLVHLSEHASLYYELEQALWPFYDQDKRSKYALTKAGRLREGVYCMVVDSPSYEQPCRAFVQRYNHDEGTADVILLDKADKETVPIESLVQLDERFAITPVSAVRVVDPLLQQELPAYSRCTMRVIALKTSKLEVELRPRPEAARR